MTLVALACPAIALAIACDGPSDASAPLVAGDAGRRVVDRSEAVGDGGVHSDAQVLDFLLTDGAGVLARARLAAAKATNADVKALAEAILSEQEASEERVRALGRDRSLEPASSGLSLEAQSDAEAVLGKLSRLSGASFDRNYLEEEILGRLKAVATLERTIAPMARDPEINRAALDARDAAASQRERAMALHRVVRADAGPPLPESTSETSVTTSSADASAPKEAGVFDRQP